jgi:hypothetical protein
MLLPLSTLLWLTILSSALLWIVVFPSQQHSPPLRPSTLFVPPQNDALQLHLTSILQCTLNLLIVEKFKIN